MISIAVCDLCPIVESLLTASVDYQNIVFLTIVIKVPEQGTLLRLRSFFNSSMADRMLAADMFARLAPDNAVPPAGDVAAAAAGDAAAAVAADCRWTASVDARCRAAASSYTAASDCTRHLMIALIRHFE